MLYEEIEQKYSVDDLKLHKLRYEPNIDYLYRPFYQPNMDYVYKPTDHPGLYYLYKPKDQAHFGFLYEPIPDSLIPDRPPYRQHRSKHTKHSFSFHSHSHHKSTKTRPNHSNHHTIDQKPNATNNIEHENKQSSDQNNPPQTHNDLIKLQPDHPLIPTTLQPPITNININYSKSSPSQLSSIPHRNYDKSQSFNNTNMIKKRQSVAKKNTKYVKKFPFLINKSQVETITDKDHQKVSLSLNQPTHKFTSIHVENCTLFESIISVHNRDSKSRICVLNQTDPVNPGVGYFEGESSQEASLCRHTLLYPTLEGNEMYRLNKGYKIDGSDLMIYSPDVVVLRDEFYEEFVHTFKIDVISATSVDNRKCEFIGGPKMMERRIKKILNLAAAKKVDVLVMCPFGCGELKNDPQMIADFFYKNLVVEGMKDYFTQVIFAVCDDDVTFDVFSKKFNE